MSDKNTVVKEGVMNNMAVRREVTYMSGDYFVYNRFCGTKTQELTVHHRQNKRANCSDKVEISVLEKSPHAITSNDIYLNIPAISALRDMLDQVMADATARK